MTDLEISKALAIAVGWKSEQIKVLRGASIVCVNRDGVGSDWAWPTFDYRDWNVISPIAEKYECFPIRTKTDEWFANIFDCNGFYADTPQKAIALAVIAGAQK